MGEPGCYLNVRSDCSTPGLLQVSASVQCPGTEETEHEPLQMAALRKLLFPPGPNAYSHLKIHDFSDSVNALPPEELNEVCARVSVPTHSGSVINQYIWKGILLQPSRMSAPEGRWPPALRCLSCHRHGF